MLQPEEVVEVFVGDTLEEAMAFAVAALGPDLSVRRARKVRKGVQGLVGRDRYEVVAVPSPSSSGHDALESAFDALLFQAEEAEEPPAPKARRAAPPAPRAAPASPRRVTTRPHPSPEVADHTAQVAVRTPARKPAARKPRARAAVVPTGWSYQALVDLGLPASVLKALPVDEPTEDLAWVVALAVAMSAVLPAPASLSDTNPLVVNGFGLTGVLGLLDAAARGLTPGTITVGDRTAAATATELALAVRSAVVG